MQRNMMEKICSALPDIHSMKAVISSCLPGAVATPIAACTSKLGNAEFAITDLSNQGRLFLSRLPGLVIQAVVRDKSRRLAAVMGRVRSIVKCPPPSSTGNGDFCHLYFTGLGTLNRG